MRARPEWDRARVKAFTYVFYQLTCIGAQTAVLQVSMAEVEIPTTPSGIACVLLDSGWSWNNELLQQCSKWLQDQGIKERLDLKGLAMDDLSRTDQWSVEAT